MILPKGEHLLYLDKHPANFEFQELMVDEMKRLCEACREAAKAQEKHEQKSGRKKAVKKKEAEGSVEKKDDESSKRKGRIRSNMVCF